MPPTTARTVRDPPVSAPLFLSQFLGLVVMILDGRGRFLPRHAGAGRLDLSVEFGIGAEAEIDRMPRPDVLAVPVGTVAHSRDRGLGRAEQARTLCVRQFGMVAYPPGDGGGFVLDLEIGRRSGRERSGK